MKFHTRPTELVNTLSSVCHMVEKISNYCWCTSILVSFREVDPEVRKLLMINEDILLTAKQAKGVPGGSINTPNSIYVTNARVIFKNPKLFGLKADIIDVNYRDISNVRLKRGMFSTEIYLDTRNRAEEISLPAVDKQITQLIFSSKKKIYM